MSNRIAAAMAVLAFIAPQTGLAQSEQSLAPAEPSFEQAHTIPIASVLPETDRSGPGYTLGDSVLADGFSQNFVIETDEFGQFKPSSNYMLDVRVGEVHALREIAKIRKTKAYVTAIAKAGAAPLHLAKDLLTRPVSTVTAVPKGIWKMGSKAVKWVGGDRRERADTENSATREAIGVSGRKREIARQLNVDPYTSNLMLQDELDRVAWASFAGGLTVTIAMAAVAIPPAATLTYRVTNLTLKTNDMVTGASGGDLFRMNRDTLHELGMGEEETATFLNNPHVSPSRKTAITVALESMRGAEGLEHIVALGTAVENEDDAVRLQRTTELMSSYHQGIEPVAAVLRWDNDLFVKTRSGSATAVLPADRLLWTQQSRNLADAMKVVSGPDTKLALWTTGVFSDATRTAMTGRGISLRDQIETVH